MNNLQVDGMARRPINETVGIFIFSLLMMLTMLPPAHVVSTACTACGPECANACGTAMFRACCFNYNKKRSVPIQELEHMSSDANLSEGLDISPWASGNSGDPTASYIRYQRPYLASKWVHLIGKLSDRPLNKEKERAMGNYFY